MKLKNIFLSIFLSVSFFNILLSSSDISAGFAIVSDVHLYDTLFGTSGSAFQMYLGEDRKLLKESSKILDEFIKQIDSSDVEFILVPGDMTKDGELRDHELFIEKMDYLRTKGIDIYVICGNHDINNYDANRFEGENKFSVERINPDDFSKLYANYGYNSAISRDSFSLSYVAKVKEGLYVMALDGCLYSQNVIGKLPVTKGRFNKKTVKWIEDELKRISINGNQVIVFMHHGVIEHFNGQKKGYPEYVIDDFKSIGKLLSKYGINFVFTGHFHATDIARAKFKDKFLFDIETGSLVTFPCPYRIVSISSDSLEIETHFIDSIEGVSDFVSYGESYIKGGIKNIAIKKLGEFGIKGKDVDSLSEKVAYSFMSHYKGDEVYPEGFLDMDGFSFKARLVAFFQRSMFKGLLFDNTPDINVIINPNSGEIKKIK